MKDNHTWVICAYGESDYLEACIQSLKNQTLQSQIICYSSTPLIRLRNFCQRYAIPFYTKQGGGLAKIGIMLSLCRNKICYYRPSG